MQLVYIVFWYDAPRSENARHSWPRSVPRRLKAVAGRPLATYVPAAFQTFQFSRGRLR